MSSLYIKLDMDWHQDPKILEFRDRFGKASLVDVINLFCALGEFYGVADLKDRKQRLHLEKVIGKKGRSLDIFLARCAEVGLIDAEAFQALERVGSARSLRDGETRRKRRERALDASAAASEARSRRKEAS